MKLLFKLAWRNIWRNSRRSIITLAAVTFAALLAIGMRGIQLGTYALNYKTSIEMFAGYLQIQRKGFQDNPTITKSFRYDSKLRNELNSIKDLPANSPRIYADGLVSYKDVSLGAAVFGIIPDDEKKVTTLMDKVRDGRFFTSDTSNEIVIGSTLLENLGAKIGDKIVILSQGFDGSLGNMKLKIVGTVKLGVKQFDAMAVFMGLHTAQTLLGMRNRVNVIAFNAPGLDAVGAVKNKLSSVITEPDLTVLTWEKVMPELREAIEFDNVSGIFFLGVLIVIVAFGILNTVLMSVTERFREFGVVLSIGMPQKNLVKLVYIETIMITLMGIVLGNLLAWGVNYYIVLHPIILGGNYSQIYEQYGWVPRMESSLDPSIFFNVSISILIIAVISTIYPAYKVFVLEPLKGIRHT